MMENNTPQKPSLFVWDKRLLISFVVGLSILFIVLNRESNGFFPDARLYPYVMTIIGFCLCLLSFLRILLGKEPNADAQNGNNTDFSIEQAKTIYKITIGYLLVFTGFYLGIWLVGFRLSAVLFVFVFIRLFGHSYLQSIIYAILGLALLEGLSRILQLELPVGLLVNILFK